MPIHCLACGFADIFLLVCGDCAFGTLVPIGTSDARASFKSPCSVLKWSLLTRAALPWCDFCCLVCLIDYYLFAWFVCAMGALEL
jgi:hypothetical protein